MERQSKKYITFIMTIVCMLFFMLSVSVTVHAVDIDRSSNYIQITKTGNKAADMVAAAKAQMNNNYRSLYYNQAWCSYFVSDVARVAGCGDIIPGDGYSGYLKNNTINAGGTVVSSPQAGDIVFYYCNACKNWVHVGLMADSVNSIEGNYNSKVSWVPGFYRDSEDHTTASGTIRRTFVRPAYGGASASTTTFKEDSKYNSVKGFKGYTCSTGNVELLQANLSTRIGYIYPTDECTVHELYTNGWCKVTCPWNDGGTRTGYTKISNFILSPTASIGTYKASSYINLYSKSNLSTQIYRIYPGDTCLTIGTSGSATQVFMPMTGKGYYELGWAKLPSASTSSLTRNTKYPVNFKCRILSNSNSEVCAYGSVNDSGTYVGHVYVDDDCVIQEVYTNGWCKFTCPFYGKTQTVYGKFSDFSSCNIDPYSLKAPKYAKTYYKSDKAAEVGWVDVGDDVTVIAVSGTMSQIIYPADVGKRCGWIDSSALIDQYTVTYNANGGTGAPSSQTANKGEEITISTVIPERTGYTFTGWTDEKGNVTYASGSKYSGNTSITLYAAWRKNTYYITYNANGGEETPDIQLQQYGEPVVVEDSLCDLEQYFYVNNGIEEGNETDIVTLKRGFVAWNTEQNGSGETINVGQNYTPNENVTLYAQYGKASFTEADFPEVPERTGCTFEGWYDKQEDGSKLEAEVELDPDLSAIYAYWAAKTYVVSYNANGGSDEPEPQTKIFGETLKLSENTPTRDEYTFKGWGLTRDSKEVAYESGSDYKNNEEITLYAVWDKIVSNLSSITVKTSPKKTIYKFGEELDTEGLELTLTYANGNTETITSGYAVSGYDSHKSGTQTITVTYGGQAAVFNVEVNPLDEIAVVSISDVIGAAPGEEIDVDITLTKNPGFSFMMLKLEYDTDALELVSAENKTSDNHLFIMDDVIMWDSAKDVSVGATMKEPMGTVTFRIKPGITLVDGEAICNISIAQDSLICYNEQEKEVAVRAVNGEVHINTVEYGNVDGKETINEADVQALRVYIISGEATEGFNEKAADVNGDGVIDGRDIIRLNQYLLDNTVKLGYDPSKAIGSNGENIFTHDMKLSITNISEIENNMFTAEINLDGNPGVAALSVYVRYDSDCMELVQVENGNIVSGTLAQDQDNKELLVWTTDSVSDSKGTLAQLTFSIKEEANAGEAPISVVVASCYDRNEKSHYGESDISYVSVPMREVVADGISLSETEILLEGGEAAELEAIVTPLDASDKTVDWESSDDTVAAVSDVGQIRALKKGETKITARIQGITEVCTVKVISDPPVEEEDTSQKDTTTETKGENTPQKDGTTSTKLTYQLKTEPSSVKIAAGKKVKMKLAASNGSILSNTMVIWKSSNSKVASVNAKGIVTFKKNSGGKKVVITAAMKDGSGQKWKLQLKSMKGAVKSIKLSGKKTVKSGKSIKLKAIVKTTKGTANKKLTWTSSNPKIAKVSSSGKVSTVKGAKGKIKITAKATDGSGKKNTITITVK